MSDAQPKDASAHTAAHNAAVAAALPLHDPADRERATRGFVAPPSGPVLHELGFPVWDLADFGFCSGPAPDTVNPSLWRHAQLNLLAGLFEVAAGIWQVRGLDLANITFVAGDSGWIVIDPLTSAETARAALALLHEHVPARPVVAVIYTHSHVDHFAGVDGVVDEADVRAGRVPVIAPEGFLHAAISENVFAGTAMTRRAAYMYGALLPKGPKGHVDAGLGKGVPALGTTGLVAPTDSITRTGERRVIDGVEIEFQLTPDAEAPAEMNFFFPQRRVLCMAENCSANLHNVYTPRGAQVRDARAWACYIDEAIERFGPATDVVFMSHQWPRFGNDDALDFLRDQRDVYRWIHDETLRLANHGFTMTEIAEQMDLPVGLEHCFSVRGYYGTVNHNAKAVYQRYLGWFDGNAAHLHPHPPEEAARRYVAFMGGADAVLDKARASFEAGDYRWVVEVVNHVVFADPQHRGARLLQADALEQLGYQAESGPWRAFYLSAAQELRHGSIDLGPRAAFAAPVARAMSTELLLDYVAIRLNGPAAAGLAGTFVVAVGDRDEQRVCEVRNGVLHHRPPAAVPPAQVGAVVPPAEVGAAVPPAEVDVVALDHATLVALATGERSFEEARADGSVAVSGAGAVAAAVFARLDRFHPWFRIVEP